MPLTAYDRQKISDCVLFVESAQSTLAKIDSSKVSSIDDIRKCFQSAREALTAALQS
jgi:hypothetical protein